MLAIGNRVKRAGVLLDNKKTIQVYISNTKALIVFLIVMRFFFYSLFPVLNSLLPS